MFLFGEDTISLYYNSYFAMKGIFNFLVMLLEGKRGIISGALDENSIAWKVAEKCFDEGAKFTLTNAPMPLDGKN